MNTEVLHTSGPRGRDGCIRWFISHDAGAAATEYATVLAVIIIGIIVSLMSLGQKVGGAVGNVDSSLAMVGDAGGGGAGGASPRASGK